MSQLIIDPLFLLPIHNSENMQIVAKMVSFVVLLALLIPQMPSYRAVLFYVDDVTCSKFWIFYDWDLRFYVYYMFCWYNNKKLSVKGYVKSTLLMTHVWCRVLCVSHCLQWSLQCRGPVINHNVVRFIILGTCFLTQYLFSFSFWLGIPSKTHSIH